MVSTSRDQHRLERCFGVISRSQRKAAVQKPGSSLAMFPWRIRGLCNLVCPSRKRLWAGGNFGMAKTMFANVECWLQHMSLDPETGLDLEGINLRAATGLEAVDYFVPGYAVWAKMVQGLADIGYDSNNLVGHPNPQIISHPGVQFKV